MSFGGFDMGSFSKEDPSENRGNAKTEDVPQMGEMPQDFDISNIPENFDMSNIPDMGNMPGNNAQGAFIGQSFSREYIILFAVIGGAIVLSALVFKRKYNKGKKR